MITLLIFDLMPAFPLSTDSFNLLKLVTCKFSKQVILIKDKNSWLEKNCSIYSCNLLI